jgi:hypothetical protein
MLELFAQYEIHLLALVHYGLIGVFSSETAIKQFELILRVQLISWQISNVSSIVTDGLFL